MEQNEKLRALETLQKKLYAYNCASNSLYLDAVTVAPKNTAEGRGVALSILAGELQTLHGNTVFEGVAVNVRQSGWKINLSCTRAIRKGCL